LVTAGLLVPFLGLRASPTAAETAPTRDSSAEPLLAALAAAPIDDKPLPPDVLSAVEAARQAYLAGDVILLADAGHRRQGA
jgi:hypothetical protein